MRRSRNLQNQEGRISNSSSGKQYSKTAIDQPEEWRLEAALVSLLTLTCGDKRLVCAPFRVLPNIQEFPHYYETIKTPIDLKSIAKNIREGNYNSWDAIKGDVELLCKNAKEFNESSSMVYKTASQLLQHFQTKVSELSQVRRFSARVISRNRELIDDLLRSTVSEFLQYSEDSLSEEDGENSEEVSEAGNSVNNEDSEEDEYSEIEDDSEVEDSSEVNDSEQNDVSEEDEDAHTQENEVLMEVEAVAINGVEKADDKGNILRRTKPAIKLEASIEEEKEQPHETIQENGYGPGNGKKNAQTRLVSNDHQTSTSMPEIPLRRSSKRRRLMSPDNTMIEKKKPDQKSVDDMRCEGFIKVLRGVWQDVRSLKLGNRSLSLPFLYLPSKKMFPDYYTIIEKPMSLACIKNKIDQSKYHDFVEMLRDMKTMCENARRYNRLGSQIHNDSYIVESVAGGSMQMHTINSPYRQSGKDWIEQFSAISNADTSVDVTNVKEDVKHSVSSVASSSNAPTNSGSQTITTAVVGLQTTSTHPPQEDSIPTTSIAADPPQQKLAPQNELHHSNTHRPHSYFTLQPPPQLEQTQFINFCQEQQPSTSTALYQHSNATLVHTQANSAETVQNSNLQQQLIHPGRLIPCARPKLTEPVFTATSKSIYIQRIVHSETYLKYIESMFNDGAKQRTISKWDKSLLASQRNTVVPSHRRLPYDWIHQSTNLSKSKPKEEGIVRALWKLRDQLVEGTADINRNPGNQAEAIPPFPKNSDITCSGGKQRQANAAPIIPY